MAAPYPPPKATRAPPTCNALLAPDCPQALGKKTSRLGDCQGLIATDCKGDHREVTESDHPLLWAEAEPRVVSPP